MTNKTSELLNYYRDHKDEFINDYASMLLTVETMEKLIDFSQGYNVKLSGGAEEIAKTDELVQKIMDYVNGGEYNEETLALYVCNNDANIDKMPDVSDYNEFLAHEGRFDEIYCELNDLTDRFSKVTLIEMANNSKDLCLDADYFNVENECINSYSVNYIEEKMFEDTDFLIWYVKEYNLITEEIRTAFNRAADLSK